MGMSDTEQTNLPKKGIRQIQHMSVKPVVPRNENTHQKPMDVSFHREREREREGVCVCVLTGMCVCS